MFERVHLMATGNEWKDSVYFEAAQIEYAFMVKKI